MVLYTPRIAQCHNHISIRAKCINYMSYNNNITIVHVAMKQLLQRILFSRL